MDEYRNPHDELAALTGRVEKLEAAVFGGCEHVWGTAPEHGGHVAASEAVCQKCGYRPARGAGR